MTLLIYGISNCDTIKKARAWLDAHGVTYEFHDYKTAGIDAPTLRGWIGEHGWERILNRAGTTFRKLPDEAKTGIDIEKAVTLMLAAPSMIKRPILDTGDRTIVGFDPAAYALATSANRA